MLTESALLPTLDIRGPEKVMLLILNGNLLPN